MCICTSIWYAMLDERMKPYFLYFFFFFFENMMWRARFTLIIITQVNTRLMSISFHIPPFFFPFLSAILLRLLGTWYYSFVGRHISRIVPILHCSCFTECWKRWNHWNVNKLKENVPLLLYDWRCIKWCVFRLCFYYALRIERKAAIATPATITTKKLRRPIRYRWTAYVVFK